MTDHDRIPYLISEASSLSRLQSAQMRATHLMMNYDWEVSPPDGCAITLSVLLQNAGIKVQNTYKAIDLGRHLEDRGWKRIKVGQEQPGDVGSTCGEVAEHGVDHLYLVVEVLNNDEMLVADNQANYLHTRTMSGKSDSKSPTTYFLRAV